jgi:hypothetical protein
MKIDMLFLFAKLLPLFGDEFSELREVKSLIFDGLQGYLSTKLGFLS